MISGTLSSSEGARFGGNITTLGGTLAASSATVRGAQYVAGGTAANYHLKTDSTHLILSSSVGSVVALSASQDFSNSDKNYHIRAVNSNLILTSSAGSYVDISGGLGFANAGVPAQIVARNSDLVLSSSSGSKVVISGTLELLSGTTGTSLLVPLRNNGVQPTIAFGDGDTGFYENVDDSLIVSVAGGAKWAVSSTTLGSSTTAAGAIRQAPPTATAPAFTPQSNITTTGIGGVAGTVSIISNAVEMAKAVSGSFYVLSSGSLIISGSTAGQALITAQESHLILSSSAGSVIRASGALGTIDLTTATLPANAVILTGSIVWDSTTKTLKVYGSEGWTPILTGAAG